MRKRKWSQDARAHGINHRVHNAYANYEVSRRVGREELNSQVIIKH